MLVGKTRIKAERGDITQYAVDAIVNAANCSLRGGGGVDGAIHRAAGPELDQACRALGGCQTGDAVVTPSFNLPSKFIIHTPGPVWRPSRDKECDALLKSSYRNSLLCAAEKGCESIAFPSISTGIYRFPLDRAAEIVAKLFYEFFSGTESSLVDVTMVCFDDRTLVAYQKAFEAVEESES